MAVHRTVFPYGMPSPWLTRTFVLWRHSDGTLCCHRNDFVRLRIGSNRSWRQHGNSSVSVRGKRNERNFHRIFISNMWLYFFIINNILHYNNFFDINSFPWSTRWRVCCWTARQGVETPKIKMEKRIFNCLKFLFTLSMVWWNLFFLRELLGLTLKVSLMPLKALQYKHVASS